MASLYFKGNNVIDVHNQNRQGTLALEKKWNTKDCWFRLFTTLVGMCTIDALKMLASWMLGCDFHARNLTAKSITSLGRLWQASIDKCIVVTDRRTDSEYSKQETDVLNPGDPRRGEEESTHLRRAVGKAARGQQVGGWRK